MPVKTELITPLYAAISGLVFIVLSVRTLRLRHRFKVSIGSGNEPLLARAIRVHGNFAEYVPTALLLLFFVEVSAGSVALIHALGLLLLAGRLLHAYGVSQLVENHKFRIAGTTMTFTVVISSALLLIAGYIPSGW